MGLMDKLKGLLGKNADKIEDGIDKAADMVGDKAGDHADKVEMAAEKAKDVVEDLAEGDDS